MTKKELEQLASYHDNMTKHHMTMAKHYRHRLKQLHHDIAVATSKQKTAAILDTLAKGHLD